MRGTGLTSRLPRAAAWLAGAAILAGTFASSAFAQSDEVAMAMPRLAPVGGEGVSLPQPLAATDAALLRRLFADRQLTIPALLALAAPLNQGVTLNRDMLGHVLAARYLRTPADAHPDALTDWLTRYPTLPDAGAIAGLLHTAPARTASLSHPATLAAADAPPAPAASACARHAGLDRAVKQRVRAAQFSRALRLVSGAKHLDPLYAARLQAEIAQGLFTDNQDAAALSLAQRAASASRDALGLARYVAGLADWRLGRTADARAAFALAARAPIASPGLRASAAYWAARASIAAHDHAGARAWLAASAAQRGTFYGQIAARALADPAAPEAVLGEADVDAVAAEPSGLRAFALLQLGQPARAEAELRMLAATRALHAPLRRAVVLVARRAGLAHLAAELAGQPRGEPSTMLLDAAPLPRLHPSHGFLIDPALVYGLTRIESNFNPAAVSGMGAQGLMQLMPHTADWIAHGTPALHTASVNLDLGQRYVAALAKGDAVSGDLIRVLASYNAGPTALARWSPALRDMHDPLLFIEAIPNPETRLFVQGALAYTWQYAARLHLAAPSLDALAAGDFPRFAPRARARPLAAAVLH